MSSSPAASPGGRPPRDGIARARRSGVPALAATLAATTALALVQAVAAAPSQAASAAHVAIGHVPVIPNGAKAAAAPADSAKLTLDIALNTPNSAALTAFSAAVNNPKSPLYHQFLAKGEVAKQFGASAAEVAAVDAALKAAGLTPGPVSSDGLFIPLTATVAQAKSAFGTGFAGYQTAGRTLYANTSAPTFDASVAGDISGVVGLDNISYFVPKNKPTTHAVSAGAAGTVQKHTSVSPKVAVPTCSKIDSIYNPHGLFNGAQYYTADAVSNIYGISSLLAGGNNGSGVTVAVFELENYDPSGVNILDGCYGSSASVSQVRVDGGPTAPANMSTGVGIESALDIENIANLAPGVSIINYSGPDWNLSTTTDANVLDTYNQIVADDKAQVISTSWGSCDVLDTSSFVQSEKTIFATAAAQGQTVVAASGDNGSTDCHAQNSSQLAVDDPASQPQVLGVGGTGMSGLADPPSTVWNSTFGSNFGASGGGVSTIEPAPSYQSGVAGPGYTAHCSTAGTTGCRQVPDVAALADPNSGYVIEEYSDDGVPGHAGYYINIIGGTSGAAPVWAAIYALADASASCVANGKAGQAAAALYAAGQSPAGFSVFRDITTGNNLLTAEGGTFGYSAGNGYDMSTGWGAPKAPGVVSVACASPVASAASYFQALGPVRVLDTRFGTGTGGSTSPVPHGGTIKLQIANANGVAPTKVTAAVLNVTVTGTTAGGIATVYPDGTPLPTASNLNWSSGETVPNLVVVPVGADGAVDLWNGSPFSSAHFIADLTGYFTSDSSTTGISTYTAVGPVRAMDTRFGTGVPAGKIAAQHSDSLQVGGTTVGGVSIPTGITGVAVNVTVTNPTANGFLTVYPNQTSAGGTVTVPNTSNVNYAIGETVPNMVIVPVGADGKLDFFNGASSGATDVIADVAGYFTAGTSGAKYHALGPDRILDTRIGLGAANANPIPGTGTLGLPISSSASAIIANLTITQPKSNGFLTAYPHGGTVPNASNVNYAAGQDIPNLAIVPSNSQVDFFNGGTGTTHLIVDISGYFSAS
jgi:subtilase family serine protease